MRNAADFLSAAEQGYEEDVGVMREQGSGEDVRERAEKMRLRLGEKYNRIKE